MNSSTSWIYMSMFIQLAAPLLNPKGYQRGKFLTMPLHKRVKFFDHNWCRLFQIFALVPVDGWAHVIFGSAHKATISITFSIVVIALYLDDYLTNDDNLKRWMKELRNKIKWKMELPVPVRVGSRVGS